MANDLEERRRAIADALRAIMAEPLPQHQHPSVPASQPIRHERTADLALLEPTTDFDGEWDDEELTDRTDVAVPPMETIGTMSRMASLALFGHV